MLDVGGKPLLEHVLGQVRDAGFRKVFLPVNYRGEQIERAFRRRASGSGSSIEYVHEPEPLRVGRRRSGSSARSSTGRSSS